MIRDRMSDSWREYGPVDDDDEDEDEPDSEVDEDDLPDDVD